MLQFGEKQCEVCVLRDWEKAEGVRDSKICLRLGGVAKVREATVSFVMSVRLSEQLRSHWTDFHEILFHHFFNLSRDFIFH